MSETKQKTNNEAVEFFDPSGSAMVLWHNTEENWQSILRGLKKSRLKFIIGSALLIHTEQPWLTCNLILIAFSFCFMTLFLYLGAVSLYYARNDLLAFVEIAHAYSFILAVWVIIVAHYSCKMPCMHTIFQVIDADIFVYKTEYNKEKYEKLKATAKLYQSIFQTAYQIVILIAVLILGFLAPFLNSIYGDDARKIIEELNYDLPVPFWFPFDTNTLEGFVLAYFMIEGVLAVIALYLASGIPYIVYVAIEINTHYKILGLSILSLHERALEMYSWTKSVTNLPIEMLRDDPFYERCIRESLKEDIIHHIEILRFFDVYQDLTSTIFGAIISVSLILLASLSLVLTKTILLFSFETVKFAFVFISELIIVFGYCFMGNYLTEGSAEIEDSIYNCPWIDLSENQKRTLKVFQNRSSINIELKGNGLFVINLDLFLQIVQTTYSIFNIFLSMEK